MFEYTESSRRQFIHNTVFFLFSPFNKVVVALISSLLAVLRDGVDLHRIITKVLTAP